MARRMWRAAEQGKRDEHTGGEGTSARIKMLESALFTSFASPSHPPFDTHTSSLLSCSVPSCLLALSRISTDTLIS
jgi:hypothetical protein